MVDIYNMWLIIPVINYL